MSEVVGDIQAMTATALHILPNTSSGGGDHTSNSCARGGVDVRVTEDQRHFGTVVLIPYLVQYGNILSTPA